MLTVEADQADRSAICDGLLNGGGAVRIKGLFPPGQIADGIT